MGFPSLPPVHVVTLSIVNAALTCLLTIICTSFPPGCAATSDTNNNSSIGDTSRRDRASGNRTTIVLVGRVAAEPNKQTNTQTKVRNQASKEQHTTPNH